MRRLLRGPDEGVGGARRERTHSLRLRDPFSAVSASWRFLRRAYFTRLLAPFRREPETLAVCPLHASGIKRRCVWPRAGSSSALCALLALPGTLAADDFWATKIAHSHDFLFQECTNLLITSVCTTLKDYTDQHVLQSPISVGDLLNVPTRKGSRRFPVQSIRVHVIERDVDFTYRGERLTGKKGDTSCSIYRVPQKTVGNDDAYLSRIVIRNCRVLDR